MLDNEPSGLSRPAPAESKSPRVLQWDQLVPRRVREAIYSLLGNPGRFDFRTRREISDYAMSFATTPTGDVDLGAIVPADIRPYVDKVINEAHTITDDDVDKLKTNGLSEDHIFEVTLYASVGAALGQFDAGLRALENAD